MASDIPKPVTPAPELTESQAYALAELCKRLTFGDCRTCAIDDFEAYEMIAAIARVRTALEASGVCVR